MSLRLTEVLAWQEARAKYQEGTRAFTCFARYPCQPMPGERTCSKCITGAEIVTVEHRDTGAFIIKCAHCSAKCKGGKFAVGLDDKAPKRDRVFDDWTRSAIFKRDGCRCFVCGQGPTSEAEIEADHIIPYCMGGPTTKENGITLCRSCNGAKSGKFDVDFVIRALTYTHSTPEERADEQPATVQRIFKRTYAFFLTWLNSRGGNEHA